MVLIKYVVIYYFNPRSPRGERQPGVLRMIVSISISIHALRGESDLRIQCRQVR